MPAVGFGGGGTEIICISLSLLILFLHGGIWINLMVVGNVLQLCMQINLRSVLNSKTKPFNLFVNHILTPWFSLFFSHGPYLLLPGSTCQRAFWVNSKLEIFPAHPMSACQVRQLIKLSWGDSRIQFSVTGGDRQLTLSNSHFPQSAQPLLAPFPAWSPITGLPGLVVLWWTEWTGEVEWRHSDQKTISYETMQARNFPLC